MLGDKRAPLKEDMPLTSEEVVKQFSYIMTEKVKKDQLEKKAGKSKQQGLIDFACAVTLTNTNSISASRASLQRQLFKVQAMRAEGHPFGDLVSRLLGLAPFPTPNEAVVDFFLTMRNLFIDKMEGGTPNQQVSMLQIVDFTRDFFDNVSFN